jgi:N-acetyl-alpha-D-glucosaminyl L-malate synthase BshA
MKIGISCYPTFGGSGIVATELAMSLAASGDEVHVLSYAMPSRLALVRPNLYFHQVVVPDYPLFEYPPYSLALASKIAEVARFQGLDLVHVHYAVPNAVSAILARMILAPRPLPVVTTLHGTDVTLIGNDPSYLATTRWALAESDAVTAVSAWLRDVTEEQLELEDHPIEVIPNFVDPERYERAKRSSPGASGARSWARPGEKILVHVSNFRPVKRVLDVLEIFLRVRRAMPARLLLVGDGPDRAKLEQRCRQEGCCDVVSFLGQQQSVEEILFGADLFLLPSENESFGLAGLEAQACELPVVGAAIGGIPEVVENGVTGLLYPVGDVDAMAAGAIALLSDPERHRELGRAARRRAVATFAEAAVVRRYRELYERVLAGASGVAGSAGARAR